MAVRQHKYDRCDRFLKECKNYVNSINNYSGDDRLIPWYEYLLWLEENFVINTEKETIFEEILEACLYHFEHEERYQNDRRLIKLFIKFISYQDDQNMHYEAMISNGFGVKVADLYINWALYFDKIGNYAKANEIFKRGFISGACPSDLLSKVFEEFGFLMSQRFLYESTEPEYRKSQERMDMLRDEMSAIRIIGKRLNVLKSLALELNDKSVLVKKLIPNVNDSFDDQNTSFVKKIVDSLEKVRLKRIQGQLERPCRLDFNANDESFNIHVKHMSANNTNLLSKEQNLTKNFEQRKIENKFISAQRSGSIEYNLPTRQANSPCKNVSPSETKPTKSMNNLPWINMENSLANRSKEELAWKKRQAKLNVEKETKAKVSCDRKKTKLVATLATSKQNEQLFKKIKTRLKAPSFTSWKSRISICFRNDTRVQNITPRNLFDNVLHNHINLHTPMNTEMLEIINGNASSLKQPMTKMMSSSPKKPAHNYSFSYELFETTAEFERLEELCAISPVKIES